jgi:hypothetical protein
LRASKISNGTTRLIVSGDGTTGKTTALKQQLVPVRAEP